MSEEPEATEQPTEVETENETAEQNPLFNALFEAAEEQESAEEPPEEIPHPSSLTDALYDIETQSEESIEEESEEQPEQESVQGSAAGEPPEAARPKKKRKKVKQVIDPEVPVEHQQQVAFSQPEESEEDKIVKGLIPEEKEYYELAKFASGNMPEHKDLDKKFLNFFKQSKAYVEKRLKDDPYTDLAEDQDYKEFMAKNRPQFSQQDAKKVERAMITRQAEDAAEARVRPEVERLRKEQELARKKPVLDRVKAGFRSQFAAILPEEVQEKIKQEGGLEEIQKEDPLRFQVMDSITKNLFSFADSFVDITQGLVPYDESNQIHKELLDWVQQEQDNYIKTGETVREGKTFMRRERFHALPEDKRTQYFTWSDDDLLKLLVMRAKQRLGATLDYQQKMLESAGYVRSTAKPKPKAQKPTMPQTVSAPQVAPSPRASESAPQPQSKALNPMSILGM